MRRKQVPGSEKRHLSLALLEESRVKNERVGLLRSVLQAKEVDLEFRSLTLADSSELRLSVLLVRSTVTMSGM